MDHKRTKKWGFSFFTIWGGQAFSLLGSQLVGFALIWHLTESTGSATVLVIAAMMEWLPRVFIGPLAGAYVDRWNRRVIMLTADSLTALATGVLIYLGWVGALELWTIFALMLIRSIGGSFHLPAMMASTSLMVPEEQLSRIQGLNQLLQGVMNIAAPFLGAILIGLLPLYGVLAIDLATAAVAIIPLIFIFIPQPEQDPNQEQNNSVWKDTRAGFKYVWDWVGLRNVLALAILINLISVPAITLMPLLVKNEFGGGAMQIATMQSSWAIGFLLGGLLLSVWGGFKRKINTVTIAMFGSAVGMLIVGIAPGTTFKIAVGGILFAGMMNVLINGPAIALLQTVVTADMQGRVLSLVISLANAMTPIGLAVSGSLAETTGTRMWFIVTSLTFVFSGIFALVNPDLRNIEDRRSKTSQQIETTASATGNLS